MCNAYTREDGAERSSSCEDIAENGITNSTTSTVTIEIYRLHILI